ncbi:MAG: glycosyltransferase family 2 protein [Pseudomonadota bacterium]
MLQGRRLVAVNLSDNLTAMVLTYNEAPNLERCLNSLQWVPRILIVDSGSTDETLAIAHQFNNTTVQHRPFDNFADQCNFGLSKITSDWALSLDADYELTPELIAELRSLDVGPTSAAAFEAGFIYRIYGKPLRGTLYPPRKILYQTAAASYKNEGHSHRVNIDGRVEKLTGKLYHDDRKPLSRWLTSQRNYAKLEADHLASTPKSSLKRNDYIRSLAWPAPLLVFAYTLVVKRSILDGWAGWFYALQRLLAETILALELIDRKLGGK